MLPLSLVLSLSSSQASVTSGQSLDCVGRQVPPPGWRHGVAVLDAAPNALAAARRQARTELEAAVCQGHACPAVASQIRDWVFGENHGKACAMAVVEEPVIEAWKASMSAAAVDALLERALAQCLERAQVEGKGKRPSVAFDKVLDGDLPGGPRADWLVERCRAALSRKGVAITRLPRGWVGPDAPRGVSLVLSGRLFHRAEHQEDVLELSLAATNTKGQQVVSDAVTMPSAAAPKLKSPSAGRAPPFDERLRVHLESAESGTLCPGQRTDVWVRSAVAGYLQVWGLYGQDLKHAVLVYPQAGEGRVEAGKPLNIGGPCGFQAVPGPDAEGERFVALVAPRPGDFGRYRGLSGACRLADAGALLTPDGFAASVLRSSDGYRISPGQRCELPPRTASCPFFTSEQLPAAYDAVTRLPECALSPAAP